MKPAKDTDLEMNFKSAIIEFDGCIKLWNTTKNTSEIDMVPAMFTTISLKLPFFIVVLLKNSVGKNSIKIDIKKIIKPQNNVSPAQFDGEFDELIV